MKKGMPSYPLMVVVLIYFTNIFHYVEHRIMVLLCCGHNLLPLYFDPVGKNTMGTPLNLKINTATSYLLTDSPTSYLASIIGLDMF